MCRHLIAVASLVAEHGLQGAQASVVLQALECGVTSCGAQVSCLGHVGFPRPGVNPVSPPLARGFLTTGPSGKSKPQFLHL